MKKSPTYHNLGNHTEALEVDFDPTQISFKEIVDLFWESHNPVGSARSSQYKSAIWFADETQRAIIEASLPPLIGRYSKPLTTEILPLETFYNAEDYHQKYCLQRNGGLMKSFLAMYPNFQGFVDSTAAARLNGFAAGHGTRAMFDKEKESYGFSPDALATVYRG